MTFEGTLEECVVQFETCTNFEGLGIEDSTLMKDQLAFIRATEGLSTGNFTYSRQVEVLTKQVSGQIATFSRNTDVLRLRSTSLFAYVYSAYTSLLDSWIQRRRFDRHGEAYKGTP